MQQDVESNANSRWSLEDDHYLVEAILVIGPKWMAIRQYLREHAHVDRSASSIRQRFRRLFPETCAKREEEAEEKDGAPAVFPRDFVRECDRVEKIVDHAALKSLLCECDQDQEQPSVVSS